MKAVDGSNDDAVIVFNRLARADKRSNTLRVGRKLLYGHPGPPTRCNKRVWKHSELGRCAPNVVVPFITHALLRSNIVLIRRFH